MTADGRSGGAAVEVLAVRGLTKRYARGAAPAVCGVDLSVGAGEIVAVVGESGCGKSTLLRLVAGLETPDAGEVAIGGRAVAAERAWVAPEGRGVGMVFQDFALFPHMSAADNVGFGIPRLRRAERRARTEEMLALVGLAGLGGRFPHQLSGGQQQRVALARALAPGPALLLLDEPFSNLDASLKRELRDELRAILRRTRATALLVVHDPDDVLALADRAAVMRAGRVLQQGDPGTLYRRPVDEYVARFFGEANVLSAVRCEGGWRTALGVMPCTDSVDADDGDAVRVCLRPEHLRLVDGGADGGCPAVVERVHAAGVRQRVVVRLAGDGDDASGATLVAHADDGRPLAPGDRVGVVARGEGAHVIPASE